MIYLHSSCVGIAVKVYFVASRLDAMAVELPSHNAVSLSSSPKSGSRRKFQSIMVSTCRFPTHSFGRLHRVVRPEKVCNLWVRTVWGMTRA